MKIRYNEAPKLQLRYCDLKPGTVVRTQSDIDIDRFYMILPTGADKLGHVLAPDKCVAAIGMHNGLIVWFTNDGEATVVEPELIVAAPQ